MDLVAALERETDLLRFRGEETALSREAVCPDRLVLERESRVQERDVVPGGGAFLGRERNQWPAGSGETEREPGPGSSTEKVAARLVNHSSPPVET